MTTPSSCSLLVKEVGWSDVVLYAVLAAFILTIPLHALFSPLGAEMLAGYLIGFVPFLLLWISRGALATWPPAGPELGLRDGRVQLLLGRLDHAFKLKALEDPSQAKRIYALYLALGALLGLAAALFVLVNLSMMGLGTLLAFAGYLMADLSVREIRLLSWTRRGGMVLDPFHTAYLYAMCISREGEDAARDGIRLEELGRVARGDPTKAKRAAELGAFEGALSSFSGSIYRTESG